MLSLNFDHSAIQISCSVHGQRWYVGHFVVYAIAIDWEWIIIDNLENSCLNISCSQSEERRETGQ